MALTRLLLVEGVRDQQAIVALLQAQNPPISCWFHGRKPYEDNTIYVGRGDGKTPSSGGYETLIAELDNWLQHNPEVRYLGIVVDADEMVDSRWQSLWDVLNKSSTDDLHRQMPTLRPTLPENGLVFQAEVQYREVTIGIWVMPDNRFPSVANGTDYGILEMFLGRLIEPETQLWHHAKAKVDELENLIPTYELAYTKLPKAYLYTWLAWRDPGLYADDAIKESHLNARAPLALAFADWVRRVFAL